jgi:hypothetical protein
MSVFNWENESVEQQLAHDNSEAQIVENKRKFEVDREEKIYQASQYHPGATPLSKIVWDMMQTDRLSAMYFKHQVELDMDIHEAVEEACVKIGLSSDDFYFHT